MGYTDLHTRSVRTKHHIRDVIRTFSELDMTARSATSQIQNPGTKMQRTLLSYVDIVQRNDACLFVFVGNGLQWIVLSESIMYLRLVVLSITLSISCSCSCS